MQVWRQLSICGEALLVDLAVFENIRSSMFNQIAPFQYLQERSSHCGPFLWDTVDGQRRICLPQRFVYSNAQGTGEDYMKL